MKKLVVGIDEVGRGPIAGPVVVGACLLNDARKARAIFKNFRDSKQMTEKQREAWYIRINEAREKGIVRYELTFVSEKIIDTRGLSYAIKYALAASLKNLQVDAVAVRVLLDGGLRAPSEFIDQQTIIKGDEKELAIALASIAAKVERDRRMVKLAKKYPEYGFDVHKGYGTKKHYEALGKKGVSPIHRRSFLTKFLQK